MTLLVFMISFLIFTVNFESQHLVSGHHRPASETPLAIGVSMAGRWWSVLRILPDRRRKDGKITPPAKVNHNGIRTIMTRPVP